MLSQLKDKMESQQNEGLKEKNAELEQKVFDLEQQLKDLLDKYDQLKEGEGGQAQGGDNSADLKKLYDLIEDLKKQLADLEKENSELRGLLENDEENNKNMKKLQDQIDALNARIQELNNQMLDKVNCEDFDALVAQIKAQGNSGQTGPVKTEESKRTIPNSREGNRIGQLEKRIKEQEDLFKKLQGALDGLKD